jgi:hypothetical protein
MNIHRNGRASKQVIVLQHVPKMTSLLRKTQLTTELSMDKHETAFILDMFRHGPGFILIPSNFFSSLLFVPSPHPFSSSLLLFPSPSLFSSSLLLVPMKQNKLSWVGAGLMEIKANSALKICSARQK